MLSEEVKDVVRILDWGHWRQFIYLSIFPFLDFRQFLFVVLFTTFLFNCVEYDVLFANKFVNHTGSAYPERNKVTLPDAILPTEECTTR